MADFYYGTTTGAANTAIWLDWTSNITATTQATAQAWNAWNAQLLSQQAALSGLRRASLQVEEGYRRCDEEERKKREKARERARELLLENLSDPQREEYERDKFFHVETRDGQRRYRLSPGSLPIRVHGEDGRRISYCIHLYGFPVEDETLAFKLLLESNEEEFLRIANANVLVG